MSKVAVKYTVNYMNTCTLYCMFVMVTSFTLQQVSRRAATGKKGQAPKEPGKGQLWDGIVSIILVEGKKMIPMDDSGGCDIDLSASQCGFVAH